jgi:hypothetical protein
MTEDLATSPNSFSASATLGIGACVELLTSDSAALASTVTTVGNFAICHWMYVTYAVGVNTAPAKTAAGATAASAWGETRYLNAATWGTAGATLLGTSMQSSGTAITAAAQGFALSATALTAYVAGTAYTQTWYQPKYADTYTTT